MAHVLDCSNGSHSRANKQWGYKRCNLFAFMQFTGQNNGRSASSASLLAKKMPLIGQNLPIMSMRNATYMERQTSEVSTRIAFL